MFFIRKYEIFNQLAVSNNFTDRINLTVRILPNCIFLSPGGKYGIISDFIN